jgi:hypothetical protein
MNNQQLPSDVKNRLESVDPVADENTPPGWSRRSWVQRGAIAFGDLADVPIPNLSGEESA